MFAGLFAALAMFFAPPAEPEAPALLLVLDVPGCNLPPPNYHPPPPTILIVEGGGALALQGRPVRIEALGQAIKTRLDCKDGCPRVFIRADPDTPYTDVLSAMSALHYNGVDRIGLIDESYGSS